jgi:TolB-like protein
MAEGVSEELLSRLAGNKRLKVLGRTSAWSFRDQRLDAPALGRKLAVDYLVEGSVRSDGPRLRVNVALVRARDGAQLWAERFDGAIGDLFVIQDRIGDAVLARLDATAAPARARPRRTRGDVHALYLTARGLVRDREEARLDAAIDLLRQAVALDPRYAPAWASLGAVLNVRQLQFRDTPDPAVQREALGYIRRAISMEPDLAEGHYALGLALAPAASAKPHLQRAVRLDPENAEVWSLLAQLHARDGLHEEALTAWRRALDIDPLWWMAFYYAAQLSWEMGERAATIRYVQRIERDGVPYPFQAHMVRADMAWRYNDYSAGFRHARVASTVADAGKRFFADLSMGRSLRAAGLFAEARPIWRHYPMNDQTWRLWRNQPPSRDEVRAISADPEASWKELPHIHLILRTLINAGRHAEVATLFDRGFRSPEAFMAEPHVSHHEFVKTAPLFAIAFRAIGRAAEAEQLLRMADAAIARRLAQGRMARWYHADCAGVWAVQGRHDAALAALERSAALGWVYNRGYDSFADIGLEPAYAALRGNPRFERLRARFQAHVARERRELLAMGI